MRIQIQILIFIEILLSVHSQIDLVPVEYALPLPFQFEFGKSEQWTVFEMCENPPYQNCWVRTRVNIPGKKWDLNSGDYVNVTIYSSDGGQCTPIINNDIHSPYPQIADFLYTKANGYAFYVHLENNLATSLAGTFDVRIDCDGFNQKQVKTMVKEPKKINTIPCGQSPTIMKMVYRPQKPLYFKTAVSFADWIQLTIPVCMSDRYHGLRYTAQASDTQSALSSRACSYQPCNANADIAVDRCGCALNTFEIPNFNNKTLFLALEGWGNYNEYNNVVIAFEAI